MWGRCLGGDLASALYWTASSGLVVLGVSVLTAYLWCAHAQLHTLACVHGIACTVLARKQHRRHACVCVQHSQCVCCPHTKNLDAQLLNPSCVALFCCAAVVPALLLRCAVLCCGQPEQ